MFFKKESANQENQTFSWRLDSTSFLKNVNSAEAADFARVSFLSYLHVHVNCERQSNFNHNKDD